MHIDALLGRQAGVLSRAQALEFLDPKTLSRRVGREWQAPHRRVVVTHNGPLTPDQRDWATLLAAPEGSALWGGSAARWDGFTDRYSDETVHVVQRVGSRRLAIPWVQVHWSSELSEADINGLAVPRRTRISRSLRRPY